MRPKKKEQIKSKEFFFFLSFLIFKKINQDLKN